MGGSVLYMGTFSPHIKQKPVLPGPYIHFEIQSTLTKKIPTLSCRESLNLVYVSGYISSGSYVVLSNQIIYPESTHRVLGVCKVRGVHFIAQHGEEVRTAF